MNRTSSAAIRKANWMAGFEAAVVAASPGQAGRIKWAHATHLFNSGYTSDEAALRYLEAVANS